MEAGAATPATWGPPTCRISPAASASRAALDAIPGPAEPPGQAPLQPWRPPAMGRGPPGPEGGGVGLPPRERWLSLRLLGANPSSAPTSSVSILPGQTWPGSASVHVHTAAPDVPPAPPTSTRRTRAPLQRAAHPAADGALAAPGGQGGGRSPGSGGPRPCPPGGSAEAAWAGAARCWGCSAGRGSGCTAVC